MSKPSPPGLALPIPVSHAPTYTRDLKNKKDGAPETLVPRRTY